MSVSALHSQRACRRHVAGHCYLIYTKLLLIDVAVDSATKLPNLFIRVLSRSGPITLAENMSVKQAFPLEPR